MVEVLNKVDRVLTIKPTPRIERLKEVFTHLKPVFEIDRARIYTRVMKETDGEPMVIRRAKAFCVTVREMPCNIDPGELFVGYVNATWAGQQVLAERGAPVERFSPMTNSKISRWYLPVNNSTTAPMIAIDLSITPALIWAFPFQLI